MTSPSGLRGLVDRAAARPGAVCLAAAAWLAVTTFVYALRAYAGLRAGAYDLGVFDQVVWNLAEHGSFFTSLGGNRSYLGNHFSPALAALAPLYWIWADPRMLLGVQSLAVAAAIFPLFTLTRRMAGVEVALALVILFTLSVPVRWLATYDFHPQAFVPVLILGLLDSLHRGRWWLAGLCFLIAVALKETAVLACAGAGLVVFFGLRRRVLGAAITLVSLGITFLLVSRVVPAFAGAGYMYGSRYGDLGNKASEIALNLLTHPWLLHRLVWPPPKIEYLLKLLAPLAFLPLLGWRYAIGAGFTWAQNALASYPQMHSVHFQYTAEILPFLLAGAADGAARLRARFERTGTAAFDPRRWLAAAAAFTLVLHEAPELIRAARIEVGPHQRAVAEALARIPRDAAVSASFELGPHLTRRERLYLFPRLESATWVAIDRASQPKPWQAKPEVYGAAMDALPGQGFARVEAVGSVEIWRR